MSILTYPSLLLLYLDITSPSPNLCLPETGPQPESSKQNNTLHYIDQIVRSIVRGLHTPQQSHLYRTYNQNARLAVNFSTNLDFLIKSSYHLSNPSTSILGIKLNTTKFSEYFTIFFVKKSFFLNFFAKQKMLISSLFNCKGYQDTVA